MAFKRSAVRSRLSPPTRESEKRLETSVSSLFLLSRETTGSAGGGAPQKSFSFKRRAKRAANSKLSGMKEPPLEQRCPFTGCGANDASEIKFSAS